MLNQTVSTQARITKRDSQSLCHRILLSISWEQERFHPVTELYSFRFLPDKWTYFVLLWNRKTWKVHTYFEEKSNGDGIFPLLLDETSLNCELPVFFGSTSLPIRTVFLSVSDGIGICPLMGSSVTLLSDSTSRNVHWGSEDSFFLYEVMGYNLAKEILSICALFVCLLVCSR